MSQLWIGVGRVSLYFRHARTLKDKRNWLKSIEQKLKNSGFSVSECGFRDNEKRAVVGFAIASAHAPAAEEALEKGLREFQGDFEVLDSKQDVFDYSESLETEEGYKRAYPFDEDDD